MEIDFFARAVELEDARLRALNDAAIYRELFLNTLELLHHTTRRLNGAQERLRQLAGAEPWHPENDG